MIAQHIAPLGDPQPRRPVPKLVLRVLHGEVGPHVPDLGALDPGLPHQLHGGLSGGVKDQLTAGKGRRHGGGQGPDLLFQEVVEDPGGEEDCAAGGVDPLKPGRVVEVAGDVLLPLPGGQQMVPHGDDIREVQVVDPALPVVAAPAGVVQPAAQVHHRRRGVVPEVVPDLPGKVTLPHGGLQKAEAVHGALGFLLEVREVVVDLLHQAEGGLVPVEAGVLLRAHFPPVEGDDQGLLDGVSLNVVFHWLSSLRLWVDALSPPEGAG